MLNGWKRRSLADLLEFRNGMNFTQASQGERVKVIGVGDFKDKEVLNDFSATPSITLNGKVNPDDLLRNDDLLFVRSNGNKALIGRCVLVSGITEPVSFSGFTIRGRVKSDEINHSFASKLVRSPLFKEHLHRMGGGSSINNLSQDTLSEFCFSLPPLPEQRKIAEILRTWDEAIEKLEALRAAKEHQLEGFTARLIHGAQAAHQHLREHTSEVSERNRGQCVDRILSVTNSAGFVLAEDQFAHRVASVDTSNYKIVRQGQYAYNPSRINVGSIARLDDWPEGALSPMYVVFELRDTLDTDFFSHWLRSGEARKRIALAAQGSVRDTVSFGDLGSIQLPLPPIEEQRRIARALSATKEELSLLDKEVETLTRQKRGLMQKLLTGEWRVELEEPVA